MARKVSAVAGLHLVRYGTPADQKYLLGDLLKAYDQLVINAIMVAHAPAALASFLTQRVQGKAFFIDPQTHAFQHDISHLESSSERSEGKIKRSVRRLAEYYGRPIESRVVKERTPVLPRDFSNASTRREFCRRVISFQIESLSSQIGQSDVAKYYDFLNRKGIATFVRGFGPSMVVAPYFYLDVATYERWLPINLTLAADARSEADKHDRPLGIQIVISPDILSIQDVSEKIISEYLKKTSPDVYLVWIDDFSEHTASEYQLQAFVHFLRRLASKADVVNLYGGYFSVALARSKKVPRLVGVTHGIEYGESRGVIPVGGGIPVPKFYLPVLHTRLPARDAFRVIRELGGLASPSAFYQKICDCAECKSVIRGSPANDFLEYAKTKAIASTRRGQPVVIEYPLPETKEHCVRHYMRCKHREYVEPFAKHSLAQSLTDCEKKLARALGLTAVGHCATWRKLLTKNGD